MSAPNALGLNDGQPQLSAVVCTRNRGARLAVCLDHLLVSIKRCDFTAEIVVIDNGSSDDTPQLLTRLGASEIGHFRCAGESRAGLSNARNTALRHARGEIIAFVDDDVYVQPNWATALVSFFAQSPIVALVAGQVLPARDGLQPIGFLLHETPFTYATKYQCFEPMGANFAARRAVFDRVGNFDPRLGAGMFFASGEDTDFFYRALAADFRMDYVPAIQVKHDHDRVSVEQSCRLVKGYGRGLAGFLWKHIWRGDLDAMRMTYWCTTGLVRASVAQSDVPHGERARARARLLGFAQGFVPAILAMWRN